MVREQPSFENSQAQQAINLNQRISEWQSRRERRTKKKLYSHETFSVLTLHQAPASPWLSMVV
jgi:hypothetical protein